jgi:hypothetical protein
LEKSESLMTADGFYEKNVGSVSFFMRVASRGEFSYVSEFCCSSTCWFDSKRVFKKINMPGLLDMLLAGILPGHLE